MHDTAKFHLRRRWFGCIALQIVHWGSMEEPEKWDRKTISFPNEQVHVMWTCAKKIVIKAQDALVISSVSHEGKNKKDAPLPKTEEEAKSLVLTKAKLKGNTCFAGGKKHCCVNTFPQMCKTSCKDWAKNKKKSLKISLMMIMVELLRLQECTVQDMHARTKILAPIN